MQEEEPVAGPLIYKLGRWGWSNAIEEGLNEDFEEG